MSSILKALKKAEQDGSLYRDNPDLKLNIQRIFNSKTWASAPGKQFFLNPQRILLILCVLICVIFIAFYVLSTDKTSHKIDQDTTLAHEAAAVSDQKIPHSAPAEHRIKQIKTTTSQQNISPVQEPVPVIKKTQQIPKIPVVSAPETQAVNSAPNHIPTEKTIKADEPIKTDEGIEEIKDDILKVQAISWAKIPEDRIAVINNNIVSENDFILNYQIKTIQKDEIILEQSGRKFSLKFRYR